MLNFTEYNNDFGIGEENSFYVQSNTGKVKITIEQYLKYINYLNPQFIVCPFEFIPPDCGKKRVLRCYKKVKHFFEEKDKITNLSHLNFIFPYFLEHIHLINKNEIDYLIKGKKGILVFTENYSSLSFDKILNYKKNLNDINLEMKIKANTNNILDIFIGFEIGCNYFEVNFPFFYSENNLSLNIDFENYDKNKDYGKINDIKNFNYKVNLLKLSDDKLYENDMNILSHNCKCFVCVSDYKKSYIHHLIKCKELNGSILLCIHNVFQAKKLHEIYSSIENENERFNYFIWFLNTQCSQQ